MDGLCLEVKNSERGEFQESGYEINFGHVEFECLQDMLVEILSKQLGIQGWSTKEMSCLKIYIDEFKAIRTCAITQGGSVE